MSDTPIYFDYNSTTPMHPEILEVYTQALKDHFANAASIQHQLGRQSLDHLEIARQQLAALIKADPKEIIFTSSATEANQLAIQGVLSFEMDQGRQPEDLHLISSRLEHPSVLKNIEKLEMVGIRVTYLKPDEHGLINPEQLESAITEKTCLISMQWANHEIGTIQPMDQMSEICHRRKIPLHTDATQMMGKCIVRVNHDQGTPIVDLLSASAHKFQGPKGVGFLYVRKKQPRVRLSPRLLGGGHERGLRSGTVNVPGVIAMTKAFDLAQTSVHARAKKLSGLRRHLEQGLEKLDGIRILGPVSELRSDHASRLPNTTCMLIQNVQAQSLMSAMPEFAMSSGSACSSHEAETSQVLSAIGIQAEELSSTIRISLGRENNLAQVESFLAQLPDRVHALRHLNLQGTIFQASQLSEKSPKNWQAWLSHVLEMSFLQQQEKTAQAALAIATNQAVITAQVGSKDCGDWLKLSQTLSDNRTHVIKLQAFGAPMTLAVGAYLATLLTHGIDLQHALTSQQIAKSLKLSPEYQWYARMGEKLLIRLHEASSSSNEVKLDATSQCEVP